MRQHQFEDGSPASAGLPNFPSAINGRREVILHVKKCRLNLISAVMVKARNLFYADIQKNNSLWGGKGSI